MAFDRLEVAGALDATEATMGMAGQELIAAVWAHRFVSTTIGNWVAREHRVILIPGALQEPVLVAHCGSWRLAGVLRHLYDTPGIVLADGHTPTPALQLAGL